MGDVWRVSDDLSTDIGDVQRVVVRTVAGEVTVTSGEQSHIDIHRESGDDVHVELSGGVLTISQPEIGLAPLDRFIKMFTVGRRHRCTVAVTAPSSASIDVMCVSADVVVAGFEEGSKIKTVSGDVTLNRLAREVDVKTVSGDVQAKEIVGGLKVKTVSGDAAVVDGSCRWVDAKAVSGDVLLDLDLDRAGTYDVTTVSGDVALRTTAEPDLTIDVKTVSGSVISDFGLGWSDQRRRQVHATLGEGGARLWVKTVSGDLRVLRGREAAA